MCRSLKYCVFLSLQILLVGPSGEKGKIRPRNRNQARPSTQWLYTGHLLWPPLPTGRRNGVKQWWTVFPADAHKTTEVPLIGLTLRSILLPHRSLHSTHVLPLTPRYCTPPPHLHPLPPKRLLTFCQRCSLVCLHSPFTQEDMLKFSPVERLLCQSGEMELWLKWPPWHLHLCRTPYSHILHSSLFSF